MAYATNPFSVVSFGESSSQEDATFTLTGVFGSIDVNGAALGITSITTAVINGVSGTLEIGTGTEISVRVSPVPTGVSATGSAGNLTIVGGTGVTPTITGVSATGTIDDPTVTGGSGPTVIPVGFELQGITDSPLVDGDEVIIASDANVSLANKGVSGTGTVNTVSLEGKAVVVPTGAQSTFTIGDETINAIQFDYESIKENYSRARTVYLSSHSSNTNTSYVRAA